MIDVECQLIRRWLTDETTIGEWMVDGKRACFILEDRHRPSPAAKVPGATCIPCGRYEIRLTWSPRFQRHVPELVDVPNFAGIRIHPGNTKADTDGCLLPGTERVANGVVHSVVATEALEKQLRDWWSTGARTFVTIEVQPEAV